MWQQAGRWNIELVLYTLSYAIVVSVATVEYEVGRFSDSSTADISISSSVGVLLIDKNDKIYVHG